MIVKQVFFVCYVYFFKMQTLPSVFLIFLEQPSRPLMFEPNKLPENPYIAT